MVSPAAARFPTSPSISSRADPISLSNSLPFASNLARMAATSVLGRAATNGASAGGDARSAGGLSFGLSVDLSGCDPCAGMTEMAVRELGAERVIFGSDAGGRSFASQLGKVLGADIPEAAKRLILGENFKRLLMPILKDKKLKT